MDLPSSREIELETLLRQRDAQIAELTVRVCEWLYSHGRPLTYALWLGRGLALAPVSVHTAGALCNRADLIAPRARVFLTAAHQ